MKEKRILEEVEKTIQAIDRLPKYDANPFLFTRLKVRIEAEEKEQIKRGRSFEILKPVGIAILLAINIFTAIYFFDSNQSSAGSASLINSLTKEYKLDQIQLNNYNME